ncbi:Uncharacterised protein [Plesiomonas shigelloides]|nr:Uncharacterised protein [Plesiomonas shigelloides]
MFYWLKLSVIVFNYENVLSLSAVGMIILSYDDERMVIQADNGLTISKSLVFTFKMLNITWSNIFPCIFGLAKS